jgi:hypothetical protein
MIVQRLKLGGRRADPLRKRRAPDAVVRQDLRLPVERKMIGVFAQHHVGDERRSAARPGSAAPARLDHPGDVVGAGLLAAPAGVFRPARHHHAQLGRRTVETPGTSSQVTCSALQ